MLSACFAACIALLGIYCAVKARQHTESNTVIGGPTTAGAASQGATTAAYNSSASAVAGIWLFIQIYLVNTMRAKNPQLMLPGIIYCIFANVSMVYAPQFATMATGIRFVTRLLEAFFTGFGIGGGVGLFIFPVTMRNIVFMEMTGYIMTLRKVVSANMTYLRSLEETDMFFRADTNIPEKPKRSPEARAIKEVLTSLTALHGKLTVDLIFAKREIALGKLGPDDLQEVFRHLRSLLLPVIGLSQVADVFDRSSQDSGWNHPLPNKPPAEYDDVDRHRFEAIQDWHAIMTAMREPFTGISEQIDQGLLHVLLTLQLIKPPKRDKSADPEAAGDQPKPGEKGFAEYHRQRVYDFHCNKHNLLRRWCRIRGIELAPDFFDHPQTADFKAPAWYYEQKFKGQRHIYRKRLYTILYMDFLLDAIARSVNDFVLFADEKAESGKLSRRRIIVPGVKRLRKWVVSSFSGKQDGYENEENEKTAQSPEVWLGDAYRERKDPEHLPARNAIERFGNRIRGIARFFRSTESAFGFRAACATMCLAIISYLHETQVFYVRQRLFWAQIMVTISMSPSAGQSVFSFALRIFGTFVAMCSSYVTWYIVDGHTAGVLVFFWFFVSWGFFIVKNYPRIIPVGMIYSITNTLVIGYELQTRKIGIATSESNGQAYYPIYELAPYRLATVCAGLFVAFVWTIFPFPISEHSELRKSLASSLYLLANYYSVVTETIKVRVRGDESDMTDKNSPGKKLEKMRQKVFAKSTLLLQGLRTHSEFTRWDVPVGGKFPKKNYDRIIDRIQDIVNFTSLMTYASATYSEMHQNPKTNPASSISSEDRDTSQTQWLLDFRRIHQEAGGTSKEITTLLSLLSASVATSQPLPPYLRPPEPYALSTRLETLDSSILSVRHMAEPGFAAFAVMQIATRCIGDDLKLLLREIKELVGELDFSFHIFSTRDERSSESSRTTLMSNHGEQDDDDDDAEKGNKRD
ncbi:hypothetical protein AAFC00_002744 [Neodothiora populina]